ncbi:MAG: DUF2793 domain-containing protein [Pseudomonadota bacterium]
MDFSAKLNLPYLLPNQAQKHLTVNESLAALDALVQLSVISIDETAPPGAPQDGDRYTVGAGATGDWAGADARVVSFQRGTWQRYAPQVGWRAWVEAMEGFVVFDGAAWRSEGSGAPVKEFGINATADSYNRLALRAPASLFDHEGAGHQLKINKAAEGDTASLLYQSGYSARAEFGLNGNDNLSLTVSPDGNNFTHALTVRADTGYVGIGTYWPTAALHVEGAVKLGVFSPQTLPSADVAGVGAIVCFQRSPEAVALIFSDGERWRQIEFGAVI